MTMAKERCDSVEESSSDTHNVMVLWNKFSNNDYGGSEEILRLKTFQVECSHPCNVH